MKKSFRILDFLRKKIKISDLKKQAHEKFSGRTMMEMLCVLFIAALISIAAVKIWDYFELRSTANDMLEDMINARAKASTQKIKAGYTFDSWTNILDATETKSSYGFQAKRFINEGSVSFVVRPTKDDFPYRFTKDLCSQMLSMKSDKFAVYSGVAFRTGEFVEVDTCKELNDLVFAFSPVTGESIPNEINDAQSQYSISCTSEADCKIFGFGYMCVSGVCAYRGYCSSNAGCECAVCSESSCGTPDPERCCNGVYCAHGCSGSDCCVNGYCVCELDSDCIRSYGSGWGCINGACVHLRCSSNEECLEYGAGFLCSPQGSCISSSCSNDTYCADNFGRQYVCKDGDCAKVTCGNTSDCEQIMGSGYSCIDGYCQSMHCTRHSDCQKFGIGYLCSTDNICEKAECSDDNYCERFGEKYICDSGYCKNAACEGSNGVCESTFGPNWICLSNTCEDANCSTPSNCTSKFGTNWTCLNGRCETTVCTTGNDCLKFGNQRCDNGVCKACEAISNCSEPAVENNTCTCRACNSGYFVENSKCSKCPSVDGCKNDTSYDGTCACTECKTNYELAAGKCCPKVNGCAGYDSDTCKCSTCSPNDSTHISRFPSESGSKCCDAKQYCLVYDDSSCACKICEVGYHPTSSGCEPCAPANDGKVGNCDQHGWVGYGSEDVALIAANVCKCQTCATGYDANEAGYSSSELGYQCCRQIENCSTYDRYCNCSVCSANYKPTPIPGGDNQNTCCAKIDGCQDHALNGSGQCICSSCESVYAEQLMSAETGKLCCEKINHCSMYSTEDYHYPNTEISVSKCSCVSCEGNYKVTASGTCRNCDEKEYCALYNDDCTCNTCQGDHVLKDGQCCDIVTGCTSFTNSCICATCSDEYVHKVLPGDATCCLKVNNCTEYNNFCECTTCENKYRLSSNTCIECALLAGCYTYSQSDCSCTECDEGYDKSNGRCCPSVTNCSAYDEDCNCVECRDGWEINGGMCCPNISNCAPDGYSGSCSCVNCNDGYTLVGDICCENVENCASNGYNSSCACTDCDTGYTLAGGKCCQNINHCTTYASSCACTVCENGYTLKNGVCQNTCTTNEDCDEDQFCNYTSGKNNLGSTGGCSTTEEYGLTKKTLSDGTRWIRSTKEMTWWAAKSFCETQQTEDGVQYVLASRASLGCGNAPYAGYCTDNGRSGFPGRTGSRLYKLQTESPAWTEGSHWQEYRTDKAGYAYTMRLSNSFVADATATNYSSSNTHGYTLCYACPAVGSCTGYDADCDCTTCSGSLIPVNGGSKCCAAVDNCTSTGYDANCACTTCTDNHTLSNGKCCPTVENCNTYNASCACSACESGYQKINDQKCCLIEPNCATYNESTCACTACQEGYRFENGTCTKCPTIPSCSKYDENTCGCTKCDNGYKLEDGVCTKCPTIPACDVYDQTTCACSTCEEGHSADIENKQCCSNVEQCSYYDNRCQCVGCSVAGYLPNSSTGHCDLPCNVTGCDRYEWGCLCQTCRSDHDLNTEAFYAGGDDRYSHQCCPKVDGCAAYDTHCNCTACKEEYTAGETLYDDTYGSTYVSECYIASVPCEDDNCNVCPDGYVPSNASGTCCRIISGCSSYDEDCKCNECNGSVYGSGYSSSPYSWSYLYHGTCVNTCPDGYEAYTNGDYHICKIEHCLEYNPSSDTCSVCDAGYTGTRCEPCEVEHCTGFSSGCSCNACESGYVPGNGVCGESCTSNDDCDTGEFCLYLTSTNEAAGEGRCATLTEYSSQSTTATTTDLSKRWFRSSKGMNWWSAQNWCEAMELPVAKRMNLDCVSVTTNNTVCTSDMLQAIKDSGWTSGYGWLEAVSGSTSESYSVGFSTQRIYSTSYSRTSTSPRAFCQCPLITGCTAYDANCACTACDTTNYTFSNGICLKKVCSQNADCAPTTFCAFENPQGANDRGTGTCRFISDFVEDGRETVEGVTYVRTSSTMSWWTAINYCPAKGMTVPSREALGCAGIRNNVCNSTIVTTLYNRWNGGDKAWLSDNNGGIAFVWFPKDGVSQMSESNKDANSDPRWARFGFCMFNPTCDQIQNCTAYDSGCNCTTCQEGYSLNEDGACVLPTTCPEVLHCASYDPDTCECTACSTGSSLVNGECCAQVGSACEYNVDCCNTAVNFCAYENAVNDGDKGVGSCRAIDDFPERGRKVVGDVQFLRSTYAPQGRMSWWTAGNWCEAKGMTRASRSDLTDSVRSSLRSGTDPWTDGDKSWLEQYQSNNQQAYVWLPSNNGFSLNGKNENSVRERFGMCVGGLSCTPIDNCAAFDENCTCTKCENHYKFENGECVECPITIANCSIYDDACGCQTCVDTHTIVDGACYLKCNDNSGCPTGEFCAFPNGGKRSKGQGVCWPISTYTAQRQSVTLDGVTTQWLRSEEKVRTWWTAETWCAANKMALVQRSSLNCGELIEMGCCDTQNQCSYAKQGSVLRELQVGGWRTGVALFADAVQLGNVEGVKNGHFSTSRIDFNAYKDTPDMLAFCTCPTTIDNCISYNEDCTCGGCADGYRKIDDGSCRPICQTNADCDADDFCAYMRDPDNQNGLCHDNERTGACRHLSEFPGESKTIDGQKWMKSNNELWMWSTKNWCNRQKGTDGKTPMVLADRASLGCATCGGNTGDTGNYCTVEGCSTESGLAYEGSMLRKLQDAGWKGNQVVWLNEAWSQNSCFPYQVRLNTSSFYSIMGTNHVARALCKSCTNIVGCGEYNSDCTCDACDATEHFVSSGNGTCVCDTGYNLYNGKCYPECQSNNDCETTEFCSYDRDYDGSCVPGVGRCLPLSDYGAESKTIDGKKWTRSKNTMEWWTAENWCERQLGTNNVSMTLPTREDIGCADPCGTSGHGYCTVESCENGSNVAQLAYEGSTLRKLQDAGWGTTTNGNEANYFLSLNDGSDACYPRMASMFSAAIWDIRWDHSYRALCKSCTKIKGCKIYNSDCTCKECDETWTSDGNGACVCDTGYNEYKNVCYHACQSNDDCDEEHFCSYDGLSVPNGEYNCATGESTKARCLPLTYVSSQTLTVNGKKWVRGRTYLVPLSAKNWCARQKGSDGVTPMQMPSRDDLGCGGVCGAEGRRNCTVQGCETTYGDPPLLAYEGSTLRALQDAGWIDTTTNQYDYALFTSNDGNACNASYVNMHISYIGNDHPYDGRYVLCREGCPAILGCLSFNNNCTCAVCDTANHFKSDGNGGCTCDTANGFVSHGSGCYQACQTNADCTLATEFCYWSDATNCNGKQTPNVDNGWCTPISNFGSANANTTKTTTVNAETQYWLKSTTPLNGFSSENWCERQNLKLASAVDYGCFIGMNYCTSQEGSDTSGTAYEGSALNALQTTSPEWNSGQVWTADRWGSCSRYRLGLSDSIVYVGGYCFEFDTKNVICTCPTGKTWNGTECVCTQNGYDANNGCGCASGYTLYDGRCYKQCDSNADCPNEDEFCSWEHWVNTNGSIDGVNVCDSTTGEPIQSGMCRSVWPYVGTGDNYSKSVTVNGQTTYWRKSKNTMNLWTAKNWCEWQNLKLATLDDIGCGSVVHDKYCTVAGGSSTSGTAYEGSVLNALQTVDPAWGASTWTASKRSACASLNVNMSNSFVDDFNNGRYFYALCTCPDGQLWNGQACVCDVTKGWVVDNGTCVKACETNADCPNVTDFCSFEDSTTVTCNSSTGNLSELGKCRPISSFGNGTGVDTKTTTVNGVATTWVRSSEAMRKHSAKNWCESKGLSLATRVNLGCGRVGNDAACTAPEGSSTRGTAYAGSALNALQTVQPIWAGNYWTDDYISGYSNNSRCTGLMVQVSDSYIDDYNVINKFKALCICSTATGCATMGSNCACASCDTANHWTSDGNGGCTCESGYTPYNGVCYKSCDLNSDCTDQSTFCYFGNSEETIQCVSATGLADTSGVCVPLSLFGDGTGSDRKSTNIDNVLANWVKSSVKMNSWSAHNWCERKGMALANRADLGCGSVAYDKRCTTPEGSTTNGTGYEGSALRVLQTESPAWSGNYWLDDYKSACVPLMINFSNSLIDDYASYWSMFALCKDNCPVGTVWNGTSCAEECSSNGGACSDNTDCCEGSFCAYEYVASGSANKGNGVCRPISNYATSELLVNVNSEKTDWIRSTSQISSWWSAENWCLAQGYAIASRSIIGCTDVNGGWCTNGGNGWAKAGTALRALQAGGWTDDYFSYLEGTTTNGSMQVDMSVSFTDVHSSYITSAYRSEVLRPLCYKSYEGDLALNTPNCTTYNTSGVCVGCAAGYQLSGSSCVACPPVEHCATSPDSYNGSCGCSICAEGYTSVNGVCYPACTTNSNCTNATDFCAFQSALSSSNKGNGACLPMDMFGTGTGRWAKTIVVNGVAQGWISGNTRINYWSVENWCERKGAQTVSRADLGCGSPCGENSSHYFCTVSGCNATSGNGYAGSVLNLLQTTPTAWDTGWVWLENKEGVNAYQICFSGSPIREGRKALPHSELRAFCKCPLITGCTAYDSNCKCTTCSSDYMVYDGGCYKPCQNNTDCTDENEFCAWQNATSCVNGEPDVEYGACVPMSTYGTGTGNYKKSTTVGGVTMSWVKSQDHMFWWTAKNWCERQGRILPQRADLGCGSVGTGQYCNSTGASGTAYAGSVMNLLQTTSPTWADNSRYIWTSERSTCNSYRVGLGSSYVSLPLLNSGYDALCMCPSIPNCTSYDENCGCSACPTGFTSDGNGGCICDAANRWVSDGNGGCTQCPEKTGCATYDSTCACAQCVDDGSHMMKNGTCVTACGTGYTSYDSYNCCPEHCSEGYTINGNTCTCTTCDSGYTSDGNGGCVVAPVTCVPTGGSCAEKTDCCAGTYCQFSSDDCTNKGTGTCKNVSGLTFDTKIITANGVTSPWKRYGSGTRWWTADSICYALGMELASIDDLGCSGCGTVSTQYCTSLGCVGGSSGMAYPGTVLRALQDAGWYGKGWHWLRNVYSTCYAYDFSLTESRFVNGDGKNGWSFTLCKCPEISGCAVYNDDCTCKCSTIVPGCTNYNDSCQCTSCATGYSFSNGSCTQTCMPTGEVCQTNKDCCIGDFCAFENPTSSTGAGVGLCRHVSDFTERGTKTTTVGKFMRSSFDTDSYMSWWSAKNWCEAKGMRQTTREDIDCVINANSTCSSSITASLRSGTDPWTDGDKSWLNEVTTNGSNAYTWFPRNNTILSEVKNKNSATYKRFAMCSHMCPKVIGCSEYDEDCECLVCLTGTLTNGICEGACAATGESCSQNGDCCSGDFCEMTSQTAGTCQNTSKYTANNLLVKASASADKTDWIKGATSMNWWRAKNWCEAMGYDLATRDLIGCDNVSADTYCSDDGNNGWGKIDSEFYALQVAGWKAYEWLEEDTSDNSYYLNSSATSYIGSDSKSSNRFPLCERPYTGNVAMNVTNCVAYNPSGTCVGCAKGFTAQNGACTACTPVEHCASATSYNGDCTCTACETGYVIQSGKCLKGCETNNDCAATEFCSFGHASECSDKGEGYCVPISTFGSETKTITAGGITAPWTRSTIIGNSEYGQLVWWGADNWCKRQGMELASRNDLECGSPCGEDDAHSYCSVAGCSDAYGTGPYYGSVFAALLNQGADWNTWNYNHYLSDSASATCGTYIANFSSATIFAGTEITTARALCHCPAISGCAVYNDNCTCKCTAIPGCATYDDNCQCTSCLPLYTFSNGTCNYCTMSGHYIPDGNGGCACESGYTMIDGKCYKSCTTNSDCSSLTDHFCTFQNATDCTEGGTTGTPVPPTGGCMPITNFGGQSKVITTSAGTSSWIRSTGSYQERYLNWWSADNWCKASGGQLVGKADLGCADCGAVITGTSGSYQTVSSNGCCTVPWCSSFSGTAYAGSVLNGLQTQSPEWGGDALFWLNDNIDTCHAAYVVSDESYIRFYAGSWTLRSTGYGGTYNNYALCRISSTCDASNGYVPDGNGGCTCASGFVLSNGICRKQCQTNSDCLSLTDHFCAFQNATECVSGGTVGTPSPSTGLCLPINSFGGQSKSVSVNGTTSEWIRSTSTYAGKYMNWWSAKNWCEANNAQMVGKEDLGCSACTSSKSYCTQQSCSGTKGTAYVGSILNALQTTSPTWTSGLFWLTDNINSCHSSYVATSTSYVVSAATSYTPRITASDGSYYALCRVCSEIPGCTSYEGPCACATCDASKHFVSDGNGGCTCGSGYVSDDNGGCIVACTSNASCDLTEYCSFDNATACSNGNPNVTYGRCLSRGTANFEYKHTMITATDYDIYGSPSYNRVQKWVRSGKTFKDQWSAKNWCAGFAPGAHLITISDTDWCNDGCGSDTERAIATVSPAWSSASQWTDLQEGGDACVVYKLNLSSSGINNGVWSGSLNKYQSSNSYTAVCACPYIKHCTHYGDGNSNGGENQGGCYCSACETGYEVHTEFDEDDNPITECIPCSQSTPDFLTGCTSYDNACHCTACSSHYIYDTDYYCNTCASGYTRVTYADAGLSFCAKPCSSNGSAECEAGEFCAFLDMSGCGYTLTPGSQGYCVPINAFGPYVQDIYTIYYNPSGTITSQEAKVIDGGIPIVRSSVPMDWFSANNWCQGMGLSLRTVDSFGCGNVTIGNYCTTSTSPGGTSAGTAYTGSLLNKIQTSTPTWSDTHLGRTASYWTSTNNHDCAGRVLSLTSSAVPQQNFAIKAFALCSCPEIAGCGAYGSSCACSTCDATKHFVSNGSGGCTCDTTNHWTSDGHGGCTCADGYISDGNDGCIKTCTSNSSCLATQFCAFPNATTDGSGTGICVTTSTYSSTSQIINGRTWVRSANESSSLNWWSAQSWCQRQKASNGTTSLQMASLSDLGCGEFNAGQSCTDTGSGGFPGKTGSALAALQSGGWTSGYHWLSDSGKNLLVFESGMIGDFDKDYTNLALCTCPTIVNCTSYNSDCTCAGCDTPSEWGVRYHNAGNKCCLLNGMYVKPCETYVSEESCECTSCSDGNTLHDGKCYLE